MSSSAPGPRLSKVDGLEVIVFDLDYTLWPFWIDTHITPPIRKSSNGHIVDAHGARIRHYPEVPAILEELKSVGYKLGAASRTSAINEARELIKLLKWDEHFHHLEIYPGKKTAHFQKLKQNTGHDYHQMLFFDDETRNIEDLRKAGVVSVLVTNGVNRQKIQHGIEMFLRERESNSKN